MPEERPPGSPGELTEESGALEHRTQELTDEVGAASTAVLRVKCWRSASGSSG